MAILDSDGRGDLDVAGTIGGVPGVAKGAGDATLGIGPIKGTVGASALISVGKPFNFKETSIK